MLSIIDINNQIDTLFSQIPKQQQEKLTDYESYIDIIQIVLDSLPSSAIIYGSMATELYIQKRSHVEIDFFHSDFDLVINDNDKNTFYENLSKIGNLRILNSYSQIQHNLSYGISRGKNVFKQEKSIFTVRNKSIELDVSSNIDSQNIDFTVNNFMVTFESGQINIQNRIKYFNSRRSLSYHASSSELTDICRYDAENKYIQIIPPKQHKELMNYSEKSITKLRARLYKLLSRGYRLKPYPELNQTKFLTELVHPCILSVPLFLNFECYICSNQIYREDIAIMQCGHCLHTKCLVKENFNIQKHIKSKSNLEENGENGENMDCINFCKICDGTYDFGTEEHSFKKIRTEY
jgi:hypothetical protein